MKYWIGFAVIAVHVVVLGIFFGPWRSRAPAGGVAGPGSAGGSPAAPQGPGKALPAAGAGQPVAAPATATPLASTAAAGATGTAAGDGRFSPTFFRRTERPLPAKLQNAAAICRTGVVVDWSARTVLWAKGDTRAVPIASLTKMMTILVVVEALETGSDLTLTTPVPVTREAALVGGRQVWLDARETFPLQDILRAALIHSANDAAFLLAQRLAGSEGAFVKRMQARAGTLGLTSFVFNNAHGLPDGPTQRENLGSAVELAYLAGRLLRYPKVVEWGSTRLSYLEPRVDGKKTQLVNTNHLVSRVPGVNGMKTGFTDKSGYCLVATCERQGRQVIVVVTGCLKGSDRDQLVTDLLEWAYATP